ncbi:hypothetical protein NKH77_16175 [Streptomyces sp. M19]
MGAVKVTERCPDEDSGGPEHAAKRLPDFIGQSVATARKRLDPLIPLDARDASGRGRYLLVETDWEVCDQRPEAGTVLTDRPVTLRAVKLGEDCP